MFPICAAVNKKDQSFLFQCEQMRDSMLLLYTGMGPFIEEYSRRYNKRSGRGLVAKLRSILRASPLKGGWPVASALMASAWMLAI